MRNIKIHKIEKTIIKNIIKGGFCSKYKGDSCNKIETRIDPIAPIGKMLNSILSLLNSVLNIFTSGLRFIINEWNKNIYRLSTVFEQLILLIIFTVNGYTQSVNYILEDLRLLLKIMVMILTKTTPHLLFTIYMMPLVNEFITFFLDSATLDIITATLLLDFRPAINFLKASINLLSGKTIKKKCNLEDYGNNRIRMNNECYEFYVPRCKVNAKTLFYITFIFLISLYVSCWISFLKIFYPD